MYNPRPTSRGGQTFGMPSQRAQQQQQLAMQQMSLNPQFAFRNPNLSVDPTLLNMSHFQVKNEEDYYDPSLSQNGFDHLKLSLDPSMTESVLSPLSASPPDNMDLQGFMDEESMGRGSPFDAALLNSRNYSMSLPVRSPSGFIHSDPGQLLSPPPHPSSLHSSFNAGKEVSTASSRASNLDPDEKKRRRRESHNAVERRRRDNINEKLHELASLLPEFPNDAQVKPNKGVILRRSVDYLRHMQLFAAKQMDRTMELETVLMRVLSEFNMPESRLGLSFTLGAPIDIPKMSMAEFNDEEDL